MNNPPKYRFNSGSCTKIAFNLGKTFGASKHYALANLGMLFVNALRLALDISDSSDPEHHCVECSFAGEVVHSDNLGRPNLQLTLHVGMPLELIDLFKTYSVTPKDTVEGT